MMKFSNEEQLQTVRDIIQQTNKHARRLQPQDIISIACVSVVLPLGYLIQVFYVLSFFYTAFSDAWYVRVAVLTAIGVNVYANLLALIRVGANGSTAPLPTVQKSDMRYCSSCCLNVPPRAYHCPVCEVCVFRRDHHCSFAATCVGHFNQRYFVAGVANLWVLLSYLTWLDWQYLALILPKLQGLHSWQILMPHVALFTGYLSLSQFLSVFFFVATFTALLFVSYLVAAQVFCIWFGQTRMEYLMGILAYNNGVHENLRQSLGTRWPLIFISPLIPSPLPSNGLSFPTVKSPSISKSSKWL